MNNEIVGKTKGFVFEALGDEVPCGGQFFMTFGEQNDEQDIAILEGKLLTVFGEPCYMSENYEEGFSYNTKATDENGREAYLQVYSAGTIHIGANFGGDFERKASEALIEFVNNAEISDYERTRYYIDAELEIHTVVNNGKVSITTRKLSEDEARKIIDDWYGEFADEDEDLEDFDEPHNIENAEEDASPLNPDELKNMLSLFSEVIKDVEAGKRNARDFMNELFKSFNGKNPNFSESEANYLLYDTFRQFSEMNKKFE